MTNVKPPQFCAFLHLYLAFRLRLSAVCYGAGAGIAVGGISLL
jgi:hypothetical protein